MCIHTYAHENIKPLGHKDKWQRDALTNQTVPQLSANCHMNMAKETKAQNGLANTY